MSKKILLSLFTFAAVTTVLAQTVDTTITGVLDEVIVTANKLPQKQSTTGKVVSVITKEQIEKSSGRTLPQLLNEQAGITINGALNGIGTNQTIYMRGASSGRTLVLVDGIPISDPSFIQNDFDINLISLNTVERIEISRGAQSTLYGSDAIAGVINIITTKTGVTKPFHAKATIAAGNYKTYRGNVQLYGKSGKFNYSAGYAKLFSGGFSSAYDSSGKGNFDNDGYNGDVVTGSLTYAPIDELTIRSYIKHSRNKTDLDASLFTDETDYTGRSKILMTGGSVMYKKDKLSITGNYQYSANQRNYLNDSLHIASFATFVQDDYEAQSHFAEVYTSVVFNKSITLLQGADHRTNTMNSRYISTSSFGPYTDTFPRTSQSQSSLYASLLLRNNEQLLNLEIGGRLNVHSAYGSNHTFTINPSYQLAKKLRLFGSIASGFKAPTLYQLYSVSYGVKDLKAERSATYELGMQYQDNLLNARAVYFHRDTRDGIDFNNVSFKYYNFLKQEVDGAELEFTLKPTAAFTLSGNYTFTQAEERSQSRFSFADTTYLHVLRRPRHIANLTAAYNFGNGFYLSVSGRYTGKRYDTKGYMTNDIVMNDYFLLGAYAEYKWKEKLTFFADARNITNTKFFDINGYNSIPFLLNGGVTISL